MLNVIGAIFLLLFKYTIQCNMIYFCDIKSDVIIIIFKVYIVVNINYIHESYTVSGVIDYAFLPKCFKIRQY